MWQRHFRYDSLFILALYLSLSALQVCTLSTRIIIVWCLTLRKLTSYPVIVCVFFPLTAMCFVAVKWMSCCQFFEVPREQMQVLYLFHSWFDHFLAFSFFFFNKSLPTVDLLLFDCSYFDLIALEYQRETVWQLLVLTYAHTVCAIVMAKLHSFVLTVVMWLLMCVILFFYCCFSLLTFLSRSLLLPLDYMSLNPNVFTISFIIFISIVSIFMRLLMLNCRFVLFFFSCALFSLTRA